MITTSLNRDEQKIGDLIPKKVYQQTNEDPEISQPSFDYQTLDSETQITVKQKTSEIKDLIRQTAQGVCQLGQKLTEVKQQLKHGQFRNWLESEFNWSISSANKFMQVSEQFKTVDFTDFNFATSALYVLAAPSTPESARQEALKLANQGENITYSLAKSIIKHHKESFEVNSDSLNPVDLTKTIQLDTQDASPIVDVSLENTALKTGIGVRIIAIKHNKPQYVRDRIQNFEIFYAGTSITVEGCPQDLTILFKTIQNNPEFAQNIFRQATLVA